MVLDGEACAHDRSGWPDFHALLGGGEACEGACLFAFDLIELDGEELPDAYLSSSATAASARF